MTVTPPLEITFLNKKKKSNVCVAPLQEKTRPLLTIGQRAENGWWTETAVAGLGTCSDLHFILTSPAEVCQYSLVSVTLYGVALIFATLLLLKAKKE